MRTNFVLIDYENVQPKGLALLKGDQPFRVLLFVGASQAKVTFEVAESMQALGERATYFKINGNGPNALAFHLAFCIGRLSAEAPTAFFHIISKDAGFDPLIAHLKGQKILAGRWKDIHDIPLLKIANCKTLPERADVVATALSQRTAGRPRTVKTLSGTIQGMFQKVLPDEDVAAVVAELAKRGAIAVDGTKVTYAAI